MDLLVVRPFGVYKAGDRISDPVTVSALLVTEHATRVVRVAPLVAPLVKKEG